MTALRVLCDLRQHFGQARDQGMRPTCLAFAASDAHAAARGTPFVPLSAECVYYHAVRREGGTPDSGATLPGMLDAVRVDGQPAETAWPYANGPGPDSATWAPPGGACELSRRDSRQVGGTTLGSITAVLNDGSLALVVMTISDAFYLPGEDGIVSAAEPVDPARMHAVVAVGHGVLGDRNAAVLVRNSWGPEWGEGGHAWLTEGYLTPRLKRSAVMTEEV